MKDRLVIVGAGLGGCFLADGLADVFDVTIVELGSAQPLLQDRVQDLSAPAVTYPHICSGLGGTSRLWHNGLIEIDEQVFRSRWPFLKAELDPYYDKAFLKLSGLPRSMIVEGAKRLRKKYAEADFRDTCFGEWLFYPKKRVNPWETLGLKNRVTIIAGEAVGLEADLQGTVRRLLVRMDGQQEAQVVDGDLFVLAAGGLGTPNLLHRLMGLPKEGATEHAGRSYEDHPCALVGEVVLDQPLYKLWNYPCAGGNLRVPLMLQQDGLQVSFQLRPAAHSLIVGPSKRVKSVISDLRNNPFDLGLYLRLLTHWDDIMEVFSFKLNLNFPTRHYSLLMVAEQPPSVELAVWREAESPTIYRKWEISKKNFETYGRAIEQLLNLLGGKVVSATIFPDWQRNVYSSSHHSGTARMARDGAAGVCDSDNKVIGTNNLYVCDGSVIPGTGIANTGLTIAALALRLADYLRRSYSERSNEAAAIR